MNQKAHIETLTSILRSRIPGATINVDVPARPEGNWFIDILAADQSFFYVIEFRPTQGFGVYLTPTVGFGCGPDEIHETAEDAAETIVKRLSVETTQ